jgi:hypothetical protein
MSPKCRLRHFSVTPSFSWRPPEIAGGLLKRAGRVVVTVIRRWPLGVDSWPLVTDLYPDLLCRATIIFTWPRKLSPRSPQRPLAAASARSWLAGDNNRGQLVTVTLSPQRRQACSAPYASDTYRGLAHLPGGRVPAGRDEPSAAGGRAAVASPASTKRDVGAVAHCRTHAAGQHR